MYQENGTLYENVVNTFPGTWTFVAPAVEGEEIDLSALENASHSQLRPLYFDFGSTEVSETSLTDLERVVEFMKTYAFTRIEVQSYTDSKGARAYNKTLSQKRAEIVKRYLVSKGIEAERIDAVGYGEEHLINDCADGVPCTDEEHALNRRIEFKNLKAE